MNENEVRTNDIIAIPHPETGHDYIVRVHYAGKEVLVCEDIECTEFVIKRDYPGIHILVSNF